MITETLVPGFHQAVFFSDSALKIVFTTLYVDVKEPAWPVASLRFGFQNSFYFPNSKRLFLLFIPNAADFHGGPDWARTSDPALIKRML